MRCSFGPRKVARYRRETGLDIVAAMTRGNTNHRVDLCLRDGTITYLYRDGSLFKSTDRWGSMNEEAYRARWPEMEVKP